MSAPWRQIAPAALATLLAVACSEPPIPQGLERQPYGLARTALLRQGWQPQSGPLDTPSANARRVWQDYPEVEDCSADGFCRFHWRHGGRTTLAVIGRYDSLSANKPVSVLVVSLQRQ